MNNPIDRLNNGTLSQEEYEELKAMFNSCPDEKLAGLFPFVEREGIHENTEDMVRNIKRNIDERIAADKWNRRLARLKAWAAAASVLLLLSLGAVVYLLLGTSRDVGEPVSFAMSRKDAGTAYLPDGTRVIMNTDSKLTLGNSFSPGHRDVTFSGEAYFEVMKDSSNPMKIHTPGMEVEVKGTRFNLIAQTGSEFSELSLDNGSVKVTSTKNEKTIELTEGECVVLDRASGELTVSRPGRISSSWQNHELYFHHAAPEYVLKRLESTYGINVRSPRPAMLGAEFTGALPSDNLDEAIAILENLYEVKIAYTHSGQ